MLYTTLTDLKIPLICLAPVKYDKAKNILPEIKQVGRHFKTCALMIYVMAYVNVIKWVKKTMSTLQLFALQDYHQTNPDGRQLSVPKISQSCLENKTGRAKLVIQASGTCFFGPNSSRICQNVP